MLRRSLRDPDSAGLSLRLMADRPQLPGLFLDYLLQRQPTAIELCLDRREPRQGGLAQPVAIYLPSNGRSRLLYGVYGALQ